MDDRSTKPAGISLAKILLIFFLLFVTLSAATISNAEAKSKNEPNKYYKSILIKPDETLSSIALQYMDGRYDSESSYIHEVMIINSMPDSNLKAGRYLIVPYYVSY